ncbi:MAG: glycosyltransferase [Candidatus Cloacimonetes bacterium]|nr:glycosyltransferase [Candidatus Cloacimonadota bacterium]
MHLRTPIVSKSDKRKIFTGAISQPELATIFRKSHIFVLPSFYEGLPLVLIKALLVECKLYTLILQEFKIGSVKKF